MSEGAGDDAARFELETLVLGLRAFADERNRHSARAPMRRRSTETLEALHAALGRALELSRRGHAGAAATMIDDALRRGFDLAAALRDAPANRDRAVVALLEWLDSALAEAVRAAASHERTRWRRLPEHVRHVPLSDALARRRGEADEAWLRETAHAFARSLAHLDLVSAGSGTADGACRAADGASRALVILALVREEHRRWGRRAVRSAPDDFAAALERLVMSETAETVTFAREALLAQTARLTHVAAALAGLAGHTRLEFLMTFEDTLSISVDASSDDEVRRSLPRRVVQAEAALRRALLVGLEDVVALAGAPPSVASGADAEASRRDETARLSADTWAFARVLDAFTSSLRTLSPDAASWTAAHGVALARRMQLHHRTLGHRTIAGLGYEREGAFVRALTALASSDVPSPDVIRTCLDEASRLGASLHGAARAHGSPLEREEAARRLRLHLGAGP